MFLWSDKNLKTPLISSYGGFLSENLFSGGWGDVWVVLYSDSYLLAFKKKGDREPKAKIFMKVSN